LSAWLLFHFISFWFIPFLSLCTHLNAADKSYVVCLHSLLYIILHNFTRKSNRMEFSITRAIRSTQSLASLSVIHRAFSVTSSSAVYISDAGGCISHCSRQRLHKCAACDKNTYGTGCPDKTLPRTQPLGLNPLLLRGVGRNSPLGRGVLS